jgi:hypothetical protein
MDELQVDIKRVGEAQLFRIMTIRLKRSDFA